MRRSVAGWRELAAFASLGIPPAPGARPDACRRLPDHVAEEPPGLPVGGVVLQVRPVERSRRRGAGRARGTRSRAPRSARRFRPLGGSTASHSDRSSATSPVRATVTGRSAAREAGHQRPGRLAPRGKASPARTPPRRRRRRGRGRGTARPPPPSGAPAPRSPGPAGEEPRASRTRGAAGAGAGRAPGEEEGRRRPKPRTTGGSAHERGSGSVEVEGESGGPRPAPARTRRARRGRRGGPSPGIRPRIRGSVRGPAARSRGRRGRGWPAAPASPCAARSRGGSVRGRGAGRGPGGRGAPGGRGPTPCRGRRGRRGAPRGANARRRPVRGRGARGAAGPGEEVAAARHPGHRLHGGGVDGEERRAEDREDEAGSGEGAKEPEHEHGREGVEEDAHQVVEERPEPEDRLVQREGERAQRPPHVGLDALRGRGGRRVEEEGGRVERFEARILLHEAVVVEDQAPGQRGGVAGEGEQGHEQGGQTTDRVRRSPRREPAGGPRRGPPGRAGARGRRRPRPWGSRPCRCGCGSGSSGSCRS